MMLAILRFMQDAFLTVGTAVFWTGIAAGVCWSIIAIIAVIRTRPTSDPTNGEY